MKGVKWAFICGFPRPAFCIKPRNDTSYVVIKGTLDYFVTNAYRFESDWLGSFDHQIIEYFRAKLYGGGIHPLVGLSFKHKEETGSLLATNCKSNTNSIVNFQLTAIQVIFGKC